MRARFLIVLACLALAAMALPFGGCGDNDNSAPLPCCPVCGDGACTGDEQSCSCPQDCGSSLCTQIVPTCGDGVCQGEGSPAESHESCPADCPLRCRTCEDRQLQIFATVSRDGARHVPRVLLRRIDSGYLVCDACTVGADCPLGQGCRTQCGPGCEDDAGGCCPVRVCSSS